MLLAQGSENSTNTFIGFLETFPFWMWIVFAGMLLGLIFGLTQMFMTHRERIEQIRNGQVPSEEE